MCVCAISRKYGLSLHSILSYLLTAIMLVLFSTCIVLFARANASVIFVFKICIISSCVEFGASNR